MYVCMCVPDCVRWWIRTCVCVYLTTYCEHICVSPYVRWCACTCVCVYLTMYCVYICVSDYTPHVHVYTRRGKEYACVCMNLTMYSVHVSCMTVVTCTCLSLCLDGTNRNPHTLCVGSNLCPSTLCRMYARISV